MHGEDYYASGVRAASRSGVAELDGEEEEERVVLECRFMGTQASVRMTHRKAPGVQFLNSIEMMVVRTWSDPL